MAADDVMKHGLEAGQQAKAKSMAEFAQRTKGKPTPTQEENDRAKLGEHIAEHEADGSDPDPSGQVEKTVAGGHSGSYQTRQSTAHKPASSSHSSS